MANQNLYLILIDGSPSELYENLTTACQTYGLNYRVFYYSFHEAVTTTDFRRAVMNDARFRGDFNGNWNHDDGRPKLPEPGTEIAVRRFDSFESVENYLAEQEEQTRIEIEKANRRLDAIFQFRSTFIPD